MVRKETRLIFHVIRFYNILLIYYATWSTGQAKNNLDLWCGMACDSSYKFQLGIG